MKTEELLRDPVFHLNVLLWMATDQPASNYRVRPLFYEHGFITTVNIEQPFKFPQETINAIVDSRLDISNEPEPELILGRINGDNKALYFEAKANSFSSNSSSKCRQARGHLVASGPAFQEALYPLESCLLCYLVPDERRSDMSDCLEILTQQLREKQLIPGPFSCHGLAVREEKLFYSWDKAFKDYVGVDGNETSIIENVAKDTDPTPLILLFTDEDCSNPEHRYYYRKVVIDQVRANLLCDLHSYPIKENYLKTVDDLLRKTTGGKFDYLGREHQKRIRRLIQESIFKRIKEYWQDKHLDIVVDGYSLSITWNTSQEKDDFVDWLEDRRVHFDLSKPREEHPTLPGLDDLN
jgi:hypothetical protein